MGKEKKHFVLYLIAVWKGGPFSPTPSALLILKDCATEEYAFGGYSRVRFLFACTKQENNQLPYLQKQKGKKYVFTYFLHCRNKKQIPN